MVMSVVVLCHLMTASAQFDFGEFFGHVEEPAGRDPRESRGECQSNREPVDTVVNNRCLLLNICAYTKQDQ